MGRWQDDELLLSDLDQLQVRLPLAPDQPLDAALAAWEDFARRGIKLRTKALITTLVARVLLGDLFMHGIGGAKYDAVTDLICEAFFWSPRAALCRRERDVAVAARTLGGIIADAWGIAH